MGTTRHTDGALRHDNGRFATDLSDEPGAPLHVRSQMTANPSAETLDARSELRYAEGELAARTLILEIDEDRLARAQIALAAKQLAGDGDTVVQFELFSPEVAPTINGAAATDEQAEPLKNLAAAIREDESIITHYGNRGEFTVEEDGGTISVNLGLIAGALKDTATVERLAREKHWAETAYNSQWQETASANNRVTEASALVLVSEITDLHPTADALIASEDGSNLIVADRSGRVLAELPGSDHALFFSQHTGNSIVRLLPGAAADHPALTAGFPPNVVFSIPGIRSINEQNR